ncbi:MAG: hypothetical protein ACKVU0_14040 [Saprospiraceae bacterium]
MIIKPLNSEAIAPGYFDISGGAQIASLNEIPGGGGLTPGTNAFNSNLIQTDQPFQIRLDWSVSGIFAHVVDPSFQWRIEVFLERYGPAEFGFAPGVGRIALNWGTGILSPITQMSWPGVPGSTTVTIPAFTVPEGLYDAVVVLRLHDSPAAGGLPCFAAAFAEFGKIEFYREHTPV